MKEFLWRINWIINKDTIDKRGYNMKESVLIKGNQHGLTLILNPDIDFETLKEELKKKIIDGKSFFGKAKVSLMLKGRELIEEEQNALVQLITDYSDLSIICLMDEHFEQANEELKNDSEDADNEAFFYRGTLRSGQVLNMDKSIIIIGDVNPGAKVISKGNIIVLGALKGNVHAGCEGNIQAFVVALSMEPLQIIISDVIARSPDKAEKQTLNEPKIAFVEGHSIYIEPLNHNRLNEIAMPN